jgi:AraC family transcriptional regulator
MTGRKTFMPTCSSKIRLLRLTDRQPLPDNPNANVVLSSACASWQSLLVEQHHFFSSECDVSDVMYMQHVIAVNLGQPIAVEYKKGGRFQRVTKPRGAISLFPSQQPFFRRVAMGGHGAKDVLYMALDPVFVSRTATDLTGDADRVELVGHQGKTDPSLWHMAMALRAGLQAGRSCERLYGESLAMALAIHLLREYAGTTVEPYQAPGELSRAQLLRAIDYIEGQLHEDVTVAGIARAVHMSPFHFSRLFKKATGQSPYRYVIEARAKRAKALLGSGRFSISEVAHQVGFADQSHLTHHVKRLYGLTPKMLMKNHI